LEERALLFSFLFVRAKKKQKPLARVNSLGRGGMSPPQLIASSPFIAIARIGVVAAPLARTEFVPMWYGYAMVSTGEGC